MVVRGEGMIVDLMQAREMLVGGGHEGGRGR